MKRKTRKNTLTGETTTSKITGKATDMDIARLVNGKNPIIDGLELENLCISDKKPMKVHWYVSQKSRAKVFTEVSNNRARVAGFVDEKTGLFITGKEGKRNDTAHIKFLEMTAEKIRETWAAEYQRQQEEDLK